MSADTGRITGGYGCRYPLLHSTLMMGAGRAALGGSAGRRRATRIRTALGIAAVIAVVVRRPGHGFIGHCWLALAGLFLASWLFVAGIVGGGC
jgi:hypothetical protein